MNHFPLVFLSFPGETMGLIDAGFFPLSNTEDAALPDLLLEEEEVPFVLFI